MFRILVIVIVPAIVSACCSPDKWEGMHYVAYTVHNSDGSTYHMDISGPVHVDKSKMMAFYNQTITQNGQDSSQMVWMNFNTGAQYVLRRLKCDRMNITLHFDAWCTPKNASIIDRSFIGAGNAMVETTRYSYVSPLGAVVYSTVTDDNCIPLVYETFGPTADGGQEMMTVGMLGITPGIANESVFTVPYVCMA